ncbi:hypothetical protein Poli38472_005652 [Pythium oligandrum]|uniref:EF-hand domain-containing protein n=1 Tax=Pythium oligandrum TaxID=41045 RepID=A0A8K1CHA2_PYTOL|nr:hypothetical protein Poli38472_005652 [Pythium oligandrum]|eukprot:TMW63034.1 hypothetical protein Poli38472_005652 [Pythium oligandrum]
MEARVDAIARKLNEIMEVKAGYKDVEAQQRMLERHFRTFDTDGSGVVDFDEFSRAMVRLNFVGVQAEVEALFDRFDEDLNGVVSYAEFARGVLGSGPHNQTRSDAAKSLLERVRERILDAGGKNGLRTLRVLLRRMDQNGDNLIDPEEFASGLEQLGLRVREADRTQLENVFRHFDRDRSGRITVDELMRGLRGAMPKRRIKLVKQAFACLDTDGDGCVTVDEVERLYDPSHHPEVLAGRLRPRDALLEFMRVFEDVETRGDGMITWHEFLLYYKDLSAGIPNDDAFELMIRNAWHLSGGSGWCANSSNLRVLVTFRDGSQRVVAIEKDLGLQRAADKRRVILQKLREEQGLKDVVDVSFTQ